MIQSVRPLSKSAAAQSRRSLAGCGPGRSPPDSRRSRRAGRRATDRDRQAPRESRRPARRAARDLRAAAAASRGRLCRRAGRTARQTAPPLRAAAIPAAQTLREASRAGAGTRPCPTTRSPRSRWWPGRNDRAPRPTARDRPAASRRRWAGSADLGAQEERSSASAQCKGEVRLALRIALRATPSYLARAIFASTAFGSIASRSPPSDCFHAATASGRLPAAHSTSPK